MKRFALLLLVGGCATPPVAVDPARADVLATLNQFYADLTARNWTALEAHFIPGATISYPRKAGPSISTAPEFIAIIKKNVEGIAEFKEWMVSGEVRSHRNLAQAWSRFENMEGAGGTKASGIDAFTLYKADGHWKIAAVAVMPDPKP